MKIFGIQTKKSKLPKKKEKDQEDNSDQSGAAEIQTETGIDYFVPPSECYDRAFEFPEFDSSTGDPLIFPPETAKRYKEKPRNGRIQHALLQRIAWPFGAGRNTKKKLGSSGQHNFSSRSVKGSTKKPSFHVVQNAKYVKFIPVTYHSSKARKMFVNARPKYQDGVVNEKVFDLELSKFLLEKTVIDDKLKKRRRRYFGVKRFIDPISNDDKEMQAAKLKLKKRRKDLEKSGKPRMAVSVDDLTNYASDSTTDPHVPDRYSFSLEQGKLTVTTALTETSTDDASFLRSVRRAASSNSRFGRINEEYCQNIARIVDRRLGKDTRSAASPPAAEAELFVSQNSACQSLNQLKTEMTKHCLKSFFFPLTDILNVTWLSDLHANVLEKLPKSELGCIKDVFGRTKRVVSGDFQAVLFLSEAAVAILKHRHLCFLETLSVALDIDQQSVLLLSIVHKPNC